MKIPNVLRATSLCLLAAMVLWVASLPVANASIITFTTPAGATEIGGNPVNASVTFITGANSISITLTNLLANPKTVAQAISDLDFTISSGQTVGTLSNSSGQQITIDGAGNFTLGATDVTGWGLNNSFSGGLQLTALGFVGPKHLIIGPPGAGGLYSNANGSIAGNGPHNPFLNQTATFQLTVPGVNVDSTITSATFSFGTTAGNDVPGVPPHQTPEPSSLMLLGTGLAGLAAAVCRKLNR